MRTESLSSITFMLNRVCENLHEIADLIDRQKFEDQDAHALAHDIRVEIRKIEDAL